MPPPWVPMPPGSLQYGSHGRLYGGPHGAPWGHMGSHGVPWGHRWSRGPVGPAGSHGVPRCPVGSRCPMGSHGVPWARMPPQASHGPLHNKHSQWWRELRFAVVSAAARTLAVHEHWRMVLVARSLACGHGHAAFDLEIGWLVNNNRPISREIDCVCLEGITQKWAGL